MKKTKKVIKKQTKKILEYTAVFEREEDGKYTVRFPSLPGCFTYGNNLKHAHEMAKEVLELWLEVLEENKKPIPIERKNVIACISKLKVSLVKN